MSYVGGQQQASDQQAANNANTQSQYKQLTEKEKQQNRQAAADTAERVRQGMIERAKVATASGESGALGISSDRLISNSLFNEGADASTIENNRKQNINQAELQKQAAQVNGYSANVLAENKAPTLIGTGLQIGGAYYTGKEKAAAIAKASS
jgi:hypothetical protein